jgi:hypothetical protein
VEAIDLDDDVVGLLLSVCATNSLPLELLIEAARKPPLEYEFEPRFCKTQKIPSLKIHLNNIMF